MKIELLLKVFCSICQSIMIVIPDLDSEFGFLKSELKNSKEKYRIIFHRFFFSGKYFRSYERPENVCSTTAVLSIGRTFVLTVT